MLPFFSGLNSKANSIQEKATCLYRSLLTYLQMMSMNEILDSNIVFIYHTSLKASLIAYNTLRSQDV